MKYTVAAIALLCTACGQGSVSGVLSTGTLGIIPEYAPTKAVVFDQSMFLDSPEESSALLKAVESAGAAIWFTGYQETKILQKLSDANVSPNGFQFFKNVVTQNPWIRDYGPITTNTDTGRAIIDFEYHPADGDPSDGVPSSIGSAIGSVVVAPEFNLDGGNLTCDDSICLVSHYWEDEDEMNDVDEDDEPVLSQDNLDKLGAILGRKVYAVGKLPSEATGHIDLWAKIVGPKKILVAQLSLDTLKKVYMSGVPGWIKKVQKFYDKQAVYLESLGFEVVRLPSPVPDKAFGLPRFRSYINALQIGQRLLTPRYVVDRQDDPTSMPYNDAQYLSTYEKTLEDVLAQHGFTVDWVVSDIAILGDGAIHCQTMQIPE